LVGKDDESGKCEKVAVSKKQFALLLVCSLIPWTCGNGLLPLLPVYAARLGANSAVAGYYLAFAYIAIALGAISAGWVSDGLHRRKLPLIIASSLMVPLVWLLGHVHTIWELTVFTAIIWLCGGLGLALISILAGLSAGENERGKIFGTLALTSGLGALIGGLGVGWLVDRWGYISMFNILAIFSAAWPLVALLLEEKDKKQPQVINTHEEKSPGMGKSFYWLFTATLLFAIPGFFAALIRSLVMNKLGFSPLDINSTGAIGGLVAMPFPLLMGWISDRIGRKTFLYTAYLLGFASFVLLAFSTALWHFLAAFALGGIAGGAYGVGNALVTDLVPRESIGKGLAVIASAEWIGAVVGFATAGYLLQNLGLALTFTIGGCVALAAVGLLIPVYDRS